RLGRHIRLGEDRDVHRVLVGDDPDHRADRSSTGRRRPTVGPSSDERGTAMNRWWAWINPRTAPWLLLTGVVAAGVGMTLTAASAPMPGSDRGGAEDVVDAVADVLLGGLGVLLIVRDRAAGL